MRIGLEPLGPCDVLLETSFKREGAQLESYRAFAGGGVFRLYVVLEDTYTISLRTCEAS